MIRLGACALAALTSLAVGCGGNGDDRPALVIAAAASLTEALEACADETGAELGAELRFSFAGSDELAAQIRQGARIDVFAAANAQLPAELREEGLLEEPVEFATNELVLAAAPDAGIKSFDQAAEPGVVLVIGSESVPVGAYTEAALGRLPEAQADAIRANVRSREPDVKGIVGKLTQGAADAGFVYATDVRAAGEALRRIPLPPRARPVVTLAAGAVSAAREPELAHRYVEGLTDGPCADALADAGFGPP
ncbi:MAG TPA: molybdate ABC transporter substrate-binding protein [Solirubrobacterales bacterium]